MTITETGQRLAAAERQLAELQIEVAKLSVLVGVLLQADTPAAVDTEAIANALGVIRQASPRREDRPQLRLVDTGSVAGQDLAEGLRRVRGGSR